MCIILVLFKVFIQCMRIFRSTSDIPNFNNAVITIGAFDGVHFGHRKILERVKSLAKEIDGESVVITFEPHPWKILFPNENDFPMLQTLEEKLKVLSSLNIDNVVVLPFSVEFSQMHPREYIENLIVKYFKPKYVVIGYDHRFGLNRSGDIYFLKQYEKTHGFKVIEISKQEIDDKIISSTTIRNALLEGDVQSANSLLQNNYLITGQVVKGDGIGKTLGYPTANLKVNGKDKLIPADGVYAVLVNILDEQYEGMLYIGSRPTLKGSTRNIEVNIFNFNQDIYGYEISVELLEFLRGDMKFENLEELKTQIKKDKEKTLQYFEERKGQNPIKNIDCTVAILNYNGLDFLESYLPSISDSSVNQFDIVVIDNGSTDDSVEFVKEWYPEIKILELSRNYGFAGGYTKALKSIQTKYTALVNSDVRVEPGWLDILVDKLESNKDIGAVQPAIISMEDEEYYEYAGAAGGFLDPLYYAFCRGRIFDTIEEVNEKYHDEIPVSWVSGAAMVVRTKLFNKLGGFDDTYFAHFEEIDLSIRMQRAGYSLMCLPESRVYHLGGGTLDYMSIQKLYLNFRNSLKTIIKNTSGFKLIFLLPLRLILDGVAGIKMLLEEQGFEKLKAVVKAHFSTYYHFFSILKRGRKEKVLINENRVNYPGKVLTKPYSIVWKYYILSKKKFSDL